MADKKEKLQGKSKYYLNSLATYFIGYSFVWAILFLVIKFISSDIAYGDYQMRNKTAVYISAYAFEVMAGIWICVVIAIFMCSWKKILYALQSQEEEVQRKKNEMLAYLAHDLRTPMTSVLGYAHILNNMDDLGNDEAKNYVRIILEKSKLLEEMMDEFFEVTKLETANVKLDLQEVNLAEMLTQLTSEYIPILRENQLDMQCEVVQKAQVLCDITKMERVFDNLMRNAIKYAGSGTNIKVTGNVKENLFIMTFENDSKPVTEEQLKSMFDSFVRLDAARGGVEGAGMGLAIVKEIIALHKGKVWAEYNNGRLGIIIQMNIIDSNEYLQ